MPSRVPGSWASTLFGLLPDAGAERRGARSVVVARPTGSAWKSRSSAWKIFGRRLAVRRAGAAELLLDPPQRLLVAVEQLDLELLEAAGDALVVEDGDGVVHDLGAVGPDAFTAGAETRDRQQRGAAKVSDEQPQHVVRRRAGPARGLELEPRVALRQLQLPEPLPVLDPMPQRDAATRKPVVGRVVVGRDEEREARSPRRRAREAGTPPQPAASPLARASRESPSAESRHAGGEEADNGWRNRSGEHLVNSALVRLSLVPRPTEFYDLFARAGANALEAARQAETRFREHPNSPVTQADVKSTETAGDEITRELIQLLNTQYVTPFDREDIYELATKLDDVVDYIEEVSDLLGLYGIESTTRHAVEQCSILVLAVEQLSIALTRLKGLRGIQQPLVELKRLEDEGDRIVHDAIAALFRDDRIDPLIVIRWKDVYEGLERAIDSCETAANVIANIAVKNA